MWVMSESGVLFQILTYDSYEQTNSIQLEFFFCTSLLLEILQQTQEFRIMHLKDHNFQIKN